MALPVCGRTESWHLELLDVHPSAQSPCCPRPHLGRNTFTSKPTLGLSYLPTRSLSCTYTLVCTHKGHTCTLSSFTHKHSLKQNETSETSPKVGGEGHSTASFYALLSFLVKLQQQSLNSIHHPLLVSDLQFESQFPPPVPGEPEPLGGPHPLGLNSEGGGEVQAPTGPQRAQPAGARRGGFSEEVPCGRE